jgi:hypothetical protein
MLLDVKEKSGNTKSFNTILKSPDQYHVYLAFIDSHFGLLLHANLLLCMKYNRTFADAI